jgi:hypothetical protein
MNSFPYLIKDLWKIVGSYLPTINKIILYDVLHINTFTYPKLYTKLCLNYKKEMKYERNNADVYYYIRSMCEIISEICNITKLHFVDINYLEDAYFMCNYENVRCKAMFLYTYGTTYFLIFSVPPRIQFQYWVYHINDLPKVFRVLSKFIKDLLKDKKHKTSTKGNNNLQWNWGNIPPNFVTNVNPIINNVNPIINNVNNAVINMGNPFIYISNHSANNAAINIDMLNNPFHTYVNNLPLNANRGRSAIKKYVNSMNFVKYNSPLILHSYNDLSLFTNERDSNGFVVKSISDEKYVVPYSAFE